MKNLLLLLSLVIPVAAKAQLLAYWDMDDAMVSAKLTPNAGSQAGSISSSFSNIAIGFESDIGNGPGTMLNIFGSPPPTNRSVRFYRLGTAYAEGAFRMDDFDTTGLTDLELSFAVAGENTFTWDSNLEVDYRVNNGSWVDFAENVTYRSGYNSVVFSFPSVLENQSDVDLRIRTVNWGSVAGYLDIDNVQVNAVPEPSTYALLAVLGACMALAVRRRKQMTQN